MQDERKFKFALVAHSKELAETIRKYIDPNIEDMEIGIVDLEPFGQLYRLYYILTFDVSPQFLMNATARERFYFSAVWEKAAGSYEVRSDKMETVPARVIDIVFR